MPLSPEQKERYFNSIFLKEIKEEGQQKLLNSKVIVIGCGGLASSSLLYLASSGVGHITVIDDDKVHASNLPRQILYNYEDINKYKVEAAKEKLCKLNPDVSITSIKDRLTESNASKYLEGYDIVLDCTDNFETKFLINDACLKLSIPFVSAGVSDYQGQVTTCLPHKSQDFKSLFSILPINIDEEIKKEDQGVFPLSVGLVSDIASAEVVKYLLGIGELLTDKLLVVNLLNNHYQIIKYPR